MVGKYNLLEKDIYKRMFKSSDNKPQETTNEATEVSSGQEFIMTEKDSLERTRDTILVKLK